jgi:hypothetical protein
LIPATTSVLGERQPVVAVDAAHSDADLGTLDERISPVVTTISTGWRFERVKAA